MSRFKALRMRSILSVAAFLSVAARGDAQGARATLSGRVTDRSTGQSVAQARVSVVDDTVSTISDSLGNYVLDVPAAVLKVVVLARAFPPYHMVVDLSEGGVLDRPVRLDSTIAGRAAQTLPTVAVEASAPVENYRLVAFERRRQNGRGQYLTEEQIVRSGAYTLSDAVKNLRGVLYECGGGPGGCHVRMARAPMRCSPEFIIDEQVDNEFGPHVAIRDVIAVEVYQGPADVPGEFAGRNAGCGVIVVWTRSGPPKRKPSTK